MGINCSCITGNDSDKSEKELWLFSNNGKWDRYQLVRSIVSVCSFIKNTDIKVYYSVSSSRVSHCYFISMTTDEEIISTLMDTVRVPEISFIDRINQMNECSKLRLYKTDTNIQHENDNIILLDAGAKFIEDIKLSRKCKAQIKATETGRKTDDENFCSASGIIVLKSKLEDTIDAMKHDNKKLETDFLAYIMRH